MRKIFAVAFALFIVFPAEAFQRRGGSGIGSGGSLPAGTTLVARDGETMVNSTTESANYYTTHGFANAHTNGWDSLSFYPIGPFLAPLTNGTDCTRWNALGWNTAFVPSGASVQAAVVACGTQVIQSIQQGLNWTPGAETVGLQTYDEPGTVSQGITSPINSTADSAQDGRFLWLNDTWSWIAFGGLSPLASSASTLATTALTPSSLTRHIDIAGIDWYFFAGCKSTAPTPTQVGDAYNLSGAATADQCTRGFLYGDILDAQRAYNTGANNIPLWVYVENGGPYTQNTTGASYIQPPELNWAVWQAIIHGARGVTYFNNSFAGPAISDDNMATTYYQTAGNYPAGISMYQQTINTDAQVALLAPQINSPKATGYVSVSPASGLIPPTNTSGNGLSLAGNGASSFAGIDLRATYYGGKFWIFSATRLSETVTNQSATFTFGTTTTGSVAVCGESRSISISANAFTDTFANAWTVHIYGVNTSC